MKIAVTVSVQVNSGSVRGTTVVESYEVSVGDNPKFTQQEVAKTLAYVNGQVLNHFDHRGES